MLNGTVSHITFTNAENGYSVIRLSSNIVVTGYISILYEGAEYNFYGKWVNNAKHGKQFEFTRYEMITPDTNNKIASFIGSGLIKGIGKVIAKNIVNKFGKRTLEVLEKTPGELSSVPKISREKAEKIGENYREIMTMQNAVMYLMKHDISLNMSIKIFKHYKQLTEEIVSKNPYKLIEDIDGIGFITADKLARSLDIGYSSPFRVRAGIVYALMQLAEGDGHTFVPHEQLLRNVCRLLTIKMIVLSPIYDKIINEMVMDKRVFALEIDGVSGIMLSKFYFAEQKIAGRIKNLMFASHSKKNIKYGQLIANYERINNIKLHQKQIEAIEMAVNSNVSVITGGPGTGKTTIIKVILFINYANKKTTQLLAPTGRAVKRIEEATGENAMTIHRCLDIGFGEKAEPDTYIKKDFVVVDEFSMCDSVLASQLLLRVLNGTQVLFVGDIDQLPSVGAGNVLADIIKSKVVPVIALTEIYRHNEKSTIISNAHKINNGEMPIIDNQSVDFFFQQAETQHDIRDLVISLVTTRLPNYFHINPSQIQVLCALKNGDAGVNTLNNAIQNVINPISKNVNPPKQYAYRDVIFREGDRVMNTVNNYSQMWYNGQNEGKGIFNGDIGIIKNINEETGEIVVRLEDGRVTTYLKSDIGNLALSYAITVHKSQGCEFDAVIVPIVKGGYMILTRNLLYTAVTRAKRIVVLVGNKEDIQKMVDNTYTKDRYSALGFFLTER
jgi:exodeoxyribonuclease V alpha subunit